ncbi:Clp protease/crotonase-like domain-containing protein [Paraburkholderia ferrariae]|uniref:hypothetical protein n=1 Tax=Paraburkholderia ferrariae TaxID=386056 RepID=UPI0012EB324D|nr:hypothetical protein [Paraburkholderia ferrariae]
MAELVYGCGEIGALTALEYNLINHVTKHDDLLDMAIHWAKRISSYDLLFFAYTKKIMSKKWKRNLIGVCR